MRFYTKIIGIYKFNELNIGARNKAIEDERDFRLSIMRPIDFISGDPEYDTPEELQKTYEAQYAYYEANDDPIIECIEANDYDYYENGEIVGSNELQQMTAM